MLPHELAQRLSALDWSTTSLQHQLAVSAAIAALTPAKGAPTVDNATQPASAAPALHSNVVALRPVTSRTVRLLNLDGTKAFEAIFPTALAVAGEVWAWIREAVAHELGCSEDDVGCAEGDNGEDFVTVDGLRVYQIEYVRRVL